MIHFINRRGLLAGSAALLSGHVHGQATWAPSRPVRIVVAWPPGGGVDTPIRLIAGPMQQILGQPIVVENRGGASGSIGAAAVAQAAADGHTLLADASPHAANASLMRGLSFDYATAFSRNIGWLTEAEQTVLRDKRVAVAGLGGVGGSHVLTLARLGIGAFPPRPYCIATTFSRASHRRRRQGHPRCYSVLHGDLSGGLDAA